MGYNSYVDDEIQESRSKVKKYIKMKRTFQEKDDEGNDTNGNIG